MTETIEMNKGIERTIQLFFESMRRPFIGAVFGVPDSGKTYLIDKVLKSLKGLGYRVQQRENHYGDWNQYESWSHSNFPQGGRFTARLKEELSLKDAILYHCSWDDRSKPWNGREDPEVTMRKHLERGLDLNIGVFNPRRSLKPLGKFDIVISNPQSSQKPESMIDF